MEGQPDVEADYHKSIDPEDLPHQCLAPVKFVFSQRQGDFPKVGVGKGWRQFAVYSGGVTVICECIIMCPLLEPSHTN